MDAFSPGNAFGCGPAADRMEELDARFGNARERTAAVDAADAKRQGGARPKAGNMFAELLAAGYSPLVDRAAKTMP